MWAVTQESGKRIPLDAATEKRLVTSGELKDGTPVMEVRTTYVTHFSTCPQASSWRR
jgi:hypothetical protein